MNFTFYTSEWKFFIIIQEDFLCIQSRGVTRQTTHGEIQFASLKFWGTECKEGFKVEFINWFCINKMWKSHLSHASVNFIKKSSDLKINNWKLWKPHRQLYVIIRILSKGLNLRVKSRHSVLFFDYLIFNELSLEGRNFFFISLSLRTKNPLKVSCSNKIIK